MNGTFQRKIRRFRREIPFWLLLVTSILLIFSPVVGLLRGTTPSAVNVRFFLSSLAGAQAAVLAIVFAIAILGIQIIATRYAPRAVSLFTKSPILLYTFAVFVVSIGLDILLLYTVPEQPTDLFIASVYLAGGLAIISTLSLYTFIQSATTRSTPEGIIAAIDHQLTPSEYQYQTEASVSNDIAPPHPLHPLYSVAQSALSNGEHATAEMAVDRLKNITIRTIESQNTESTDSRSEVALHLFQPVLERYFPEIVLHAVEKDEIGIARDAIDATAEIGTVGIETPNEYVADQAGNGFVEIVKETGQTEEDRRLVQRTFTKHGDLISEVSNKPAPATTDLMLSHMDHWIEVVLFRREMDAEPYPYQHLTDEYFDDLITIQSNLLSHHSRTISDEPFDWHAGVEKDEMTNQAPVYALNQCRKAIENLNEQILYKFDHTGEYPILKGNYRWTWQRCCVNAVNSEFPEYGILITQLLVEVAYVASKIDSDEKSFWKRTIADVAMEGDRNIVTKAFENIESQGSEYQRNIEFVQSSQSKDSESALRRMIKKSHDHSFQEWSSDFYGDVLEEYRSLKDKSN